MHETGEVFDRRSAARVNTVTSLEIRYENAAQEEIKLKGVALDLSEHSVSVIVPNPLPYDGTVFDLNVSLDDSNEFRTCGSVTSPGIQTTDGRYKYGIKIGPVDARNRRLLSSWLAKTLLKTDSYKDRRFQRTIQSEYVTFKNSQGEQIAGFIDSPIDSPPSRLPFLILSPGFGETKANTLSLSFMLAKNGFRVLRYDPTNHVGESDGMIVDCTLSKLKQDMGVCIDFAQRQHAVSSVGLVVSSLSALVGFQLAAEDPRVSFLGALVPIVDLRKTLKSVYNEDLVGEYIQGRRWGLIDMLGFPIDADRFLDDAIRSGFSSLEVMTETIAKIQAPLWCVAASEDPWVLVEDLKNALAARNGGRTTRYTVVKEGMHQLHENPLASRSALFEITKAAVQALHHREPADQDIVQPRFREVAIQFRLERERRKLISGVGKEGEVLFWTGYLQKFRSILRIPDFNDFYQTIEEMSGGVQSGDSILDAGCGNGSLGLWLLQKHGLLPLRERPAYTYVGADFVSSALVNARATHSEILQRPLATSETAISPAHFVYVLADLDHKLPFLDGYFQKIYCNLVLSYVRHYHNALRELYRVLAPGGVLVVTSLKPYADLSAVYRNFLDQAKNAADIEEAKGLLANAGLIRSRESEGHYKFFSEAELTGMMLELGIENPKVVRAFANQANIAVIRKGAS
jgi:ubiquinone/menaquinone biosynthesis C-methylase UbiE/pimeloyl-ACP methyl ester carboxylesterase